MRNDDAPGPPTNLSRLVPSSSSGRQSWRDRSLDLRQAWRVRARSRAYYNTVTTRQPRCSHRRHLARGGRWVGSAAACMGPRRSARRMCTKQWSMILSHRSHSQPPGNSFSKGHVGRQVPILFALLLHLVSQRRNTILKKKSCMPHTMGGGRDVTGKCQQLSMSRRCGMHQGAGLDHLQKKSSTLPRELLGYRDVAPQWTACEIVVRYDGWRQTAGNLFCTLPKRRLLKALVYDGTAKYDAKVVTKCWLFVCF